MTGMEVAQSSRRLDHSWNACFSRFISRAPSHREVSALVFRRAAGEAQRCEILVEMHARSFCDGPQRFAVGANVRLLKSRRGTVKPARSATGSFTLVMHDRNNGAVMQKCATGMNPADLAKPTPLALCPS